MKYAILSLVLLAGICGAETERVENPLIPFLAVTGRPTEADLVRKVSSLKADGFGSFLIYARSGLQIEYMGEDWLNCVDVLCREAGRQGLRVWLYDDYNWPSGTCKGRVPNEKASRRYAELALYRDASGAFSWKKVFAPSGWVNVLDDEAMSRFVALTHEVYERRLSKWFAKKTIAGIFTDEPGHPTAITFDGKPLCHFAWWDGLEKVYQEKTGRSLRRDVEAWCAGSGSDAVWETYAELKGRRFRANYFDRLRAWCDKVGILATGHMISEDDVSGSCLYNGNPLHALKGLSLPGLDEIGSRADANAEWLTLALAQHAAVRSGNGGLAELFALGPNDMTPARVRQMIWLVALFGIDHYALSMHALDHRGLVEKHGYLPPIQEGYPGHGEMRGLIADAQAAARIARRKDLVGQAAIRYPQRMAARAAHANGPVPDVRGLIGAMERLQLTPLLIEEDETSNLPYVFRISKDGVLKEERTGTSFRSSAEAADWLWPRAAKSVRYLESDGTPARDLVVREYADGSSVALDIRNCGDRQLTFVSGDLRLICSLPKRGVLRLAPGERPPEPVDPQTRHWTPAAMAFPYALDRDNVIRLNFGADRVARFTLTEPLRLKLVLRDFALSYAVTETGRPVDFEAPAPGEKVFRHTAEPYVFELDGQRLDGLSSTKALPIEYCPLYRETELLMLDAGPHELRLVTGEADRNFFLPAAFVAGAVARHGEALGPLPARLGFGALADYGLGDYCGKLTYRIGRVMPTSDTIRVLTGGLLTRVRWNGRDLGIRGWAPFDWKLPSKVPGSLDVSVYTPAVNILGDVKRPQADWDVLFWKSPRDEDYAAGLFRDEDDYEGLSSVGAPVSLDLEFRRPDPNAKPGLREASAAKYAAVKAHLDGSGIAYREIGAHEKPHTRFVLNVHGNDVGEMHGSCVYGKPVDDLLKEIDRRRARAAHTPVPSAPDADPLQRWLDRAVGTESRTLTLAPGEIHRLTRPLRLDARHSGLVVEGNGAVVEAGRSVTGWREEGRLLVADVPDWDGEILSLWVNGRRAILAQTPNGDGARMKTAPLKEPLACPYPFNAKKDGVSVAADALAGVLASSDDERAEAFVDYTIAWFTPKCRLVQAYTNGDGTANLLARNVPCLSGTSWPGGYVKFNFGPYDCTWSGEAGAVVSNLRRLLDAPGEFFFDRKARKLLYMPREGETAGNVTAHFATLERALEIAGESPDARVRDVTIRNVTFRYGRQNRNAPDGFAPAAQSAAACGGFLHVSNAEGVRLEDIRIEHCDVYGVAFAGGVWDSALVGSTLDDCGSGGVRVGVDYTVIPPGDDRHDPRQSGYVDIVGNTIRGYGRWNWSGCGVILFDVGNCRVEGNDIADGFYSGVSVGWTWHALKAHTQNNRIVRNRISNLGQGVIDDLAGIYALGGESYGSVIAENDIRDIRRRNYGGFGIYLDSRAGYYLVESNRCENCDDGGFFKNQGVRNVVRGNRFLYGRYTQLGDEPADDDDILFEDNVIVYRAPAKVFRSHIPRSTRGIWRNNTYWCENGPVTFGPQRYTLKDLQRFGLEKGSRIADPHGTVEQADSGAVSWPLETLYRTPRTIPADAYRTNGVKVAFLEGLPYHGKPTKVFCYYGVPARKAGERVPGMVLVHGGGGSAFARWVKFWNDRGYAAIAMDTCGSISGNVRGCEQDGHFRHSDGGPQGWGGFWQLGEDVRDQWMYHAVADVIAAHTFLRSREGVDPNRIGVTGVSWGGVISAIVAGVDGRFAFAAPVYGCGAFLTNSPAWAKTVRDIGSEKAVDWQMLWDPIHYLARAKMPVHWLVGTNDRAFSLPALMESYAAVPTEKSLAVKIRLAHAHGTVSEEALEVTTWADRHLRGVPLPRPVRAELCFTRDDARNWTDRRWETMPARLVGGRPVADIPPNATAYYFNTYAENGFVDSTPISTRTDGRPCGGSPADTHLEVK